jgi:hypothetical protein
VAGRGGQAEGRAILVVSFYTPNYAEHAARLKASLIAHDLPHWVEAVGTLDGDIPSQPVERWAWVCSRKAAFVGRALRSYSGPVLWLDADAEVRRPLDWDWLASEEWWDVDFAIYRQPAARPKLQFRSGTAFFNQTAGAHALVRRWEERCAEDRARWDQESLYLAWQDLHDVVDAFWLPMTYCQRFDEPRPLKVDHPHIVHHQASRKTKKG